VLRLEIEELDTTWSVSICLKVIVVPTHPYGIVMIDRDDLGDVVDEILLDWLI